MSNCFDHLLNHALPPRSSAPQTLAAQLGRGGSQTSLAEGIGAFELPWLGCWDILYAGGGDAFDGLRNTDRRRLQLTSAKLFINGPPRAGEELEGYGRDGGCSTELTYAVPDEREGGRVGAGSRRRLLVARSGTLVKLPAFAYRLEVAPLAETFLFDAFSSDDEHRGQVGPALTPLRDVDMLGTLPLVANAARGGAGTLRDITYLDERVWISRSRDDGALTILQRCGSRAQAPPPTRPDLTGPCSETGWSTRGAGRLCRSSQLF